MTGVPRPYRAVAHVPDPTGGRSRLVAGHTAAKSRAGLDRFKADHEDRGHLVTIVEIRTFDEIEDRPED